MKDTWFIIRKLIAAIVFLVVFAAMGIATGRKSMILAYGLFFLIVFAVIYFLIRKNQRHYEVINQVNPLFKKIVGIALIAVAVLLPAILLNSVQLFDTSTIKAGAAFFAAVLGVTLLLIAGGTAGTFLINTAQNNTAKRVGGYAIIIVLSAIPALLVSHYDKTTTGIGSVYYVVIFVSALAWTGLTTLLNKE